MTYFIFDGVIKEGETFQIEGEEAKHILLSRRIRKGQVINVQDQEKCRYRSEVTVKERKSLVLMPLEELQTPSEPKLKIHLYQAVVKEKALDNIIQKATELGVAGIHMFYGDRSQNLGSGADRKISRWERVALEACKQSDRVEPPEITLNDDSSGVEGLDLSSAPTFCLSLAGTPQPLKEVELAGDRINLVIGPEGGWTDEEEEVLKNNTVHIGPRTLRADTAAIAAISIVQCLFGDLSVFPVIENQQPA